MKKSTLLVLILMVPMLSGCVALAVGVVAGAAVGYYVSHDDHK